MRCLSISFLFLSCRLFRQPDINFCVVTIREDFLLRQRAGDFGGRPNQQGTFGIGLARRDECPGGNHAVPAHLTAIEKDGPHPHDGILSNRTPVEDRSVADRNVISKNNRVSPVHMEDTAIL